MGAKAEEESPPFGPPPPTEDEDENKESQDLREEDEDEDEDEEEESDDVSHHQHSLEPSTSSPVRQGYRDHHGTYIPVSRFSVCRSLCSLDVLSHAIQDNKMPPHDVHQARRWQPNVGRSSRVTGSRVLTTPVKHRHHSSPPSIPLEIEVSPRNQTHHLQHRAHSSLTPPHSIPGPAKDPIHRHCHRRPHRPHILPSIQICPECSMGGQFSKWT